MTDLPNKPSELIRLALTDIARAERSKRYAIHMGVWHSPQGFSPEEGLPCDVCFAGAVMAFSLGAQPDKDTVPETFGEKNARKLNALDNFRAGYIRAGLSAMDFEQPAELTDYQSVGSYYEDRLHWKRRMRVMASLLERNGL